MARLPQPHSDEGVWGDVLNEFLRVEHNEDGSLRADGTLASKYTKPVTGIPRSDLDPSVRAALDQAGTTTTDTNAVHLARTETITGDKDFTGLLTHKGKAVVDTTDARLTDARSPILHGLTHNPGGVDAIDWAGKIHATGTNLPTASTSNAGTLFYCTTDAKLYRSDGTTWTAVASPSADATNNARGVVQLTGDLGGNATSPTVTSTHLSAALPIAQGGTGATTQNFVDLTSSQTIGGVKTFVSSPSVPTPINANDAATKGYVDGTSATFFNVRAYGATGNGATDDSTAIQTAANAAAGGTLYFPPGTFVISKTLQLSAGTRVIFAGRNAVLKYTGTNAAIKAAEFKGLIIEGGGEIDISKAGTNAMGIHLYGIWMATINDMKITQGPSNSIGVYIETSLNPGDKYGSYCINIINIDLLVGAGASGIQTAQTTGDSGSVNRVTHLQIINGWCKGKINGLYLEQASTAWVDGFVVDTGTNGYYIKDSDNVMMRPGELGPVSGWAITFASGSDLQGICLMMPSYAGLSGTLGYLDTSYYQPTIIDRSHIVLKASAGDNKYLANLSTLYNYNKSLSLVAQGGGNQVELLSWGDSAGLVLQGGNGHINLSDNVVVAKSGTTSTLGVKSSDLSQQLLMYHTGASGQGQIESTTGFVLASDNGSTAIIGTVNPQLKVQYNGGTFASVNINHNDTDGAISSNKGNLSLTPGAGGTLQLNGNISVTGTINATGASIPRVTALTDAATISVNCDLTDTGYVILGGNRTLANPSGSPYDGQKLTLRLKQDPTGGRTIVWGTNYRFSTDIPQPVLTVIAGKTDYTTFAYNAVDGKWDCVLVSRGY